MKAIARLSGGSTLYEDDRPENNDERNQHLASMDDVFCFDLARSSLPMPLPSLSVRVKRSHFVTRSLNSSERYSQIDQDSSNE